MSAAGSGRSGENSEYVINTVRHLRELGLHDAVLEWLADRLEEEAKPIGVTI